MKILIVANNDIGLYRFRKELLQALLKENEVIVALPNGELIPEIEKLGCRFVPCEFDRRGTNPLKEVKLLSFYKKLLADTAPDLVLTYTVKPNVYAGAACASMKIPYLANVTGLGTALKDGGLLSRVTLTLYRFGLRKAQTVFFQNEENRDFMLKNHTVSGDNVLLPGSGVNTAENACEPYPDEDGSVRLLFIGRIMKDKGIEELFECAETIHKRHPEVSFGIAGSYDEEKYTAEMDRLCADGCINYYGLRSDIHELMAQQHAIVHPSYHEGMSNVLLEAAACGRPVIASNVSGCRETYDDGVSGIGFPAKDAGALIEAVEKFLALPYEEKRLMGLNGRKKIENEFDRELVIKAYLQEIEKAEKNGGKAHGAL